MSSNGTGKLGDLETKEAENPSVVCFCGGLAKTSFALDHQSESDLNSSTKLRDSSWIGVCVELLCEGGSVLE